MEKKIDCNFYKNNSWVKLNLIFIYHKNYCCHFSLWVCAKKIVVIKLNVKGNTPKWALFISQNVAYIEAKSVSNNGSWICIDTKNYLTLNKSASFFLGILFYWSINWTEPPKTCIANCRQWRRMYFHHIISHWLLIS